MGIVRVAMYLRLSNEDRDKGSKEESDSISAQRALIEAAKGGKVDMIVVKDFSRFGRDYLEVGRFLEYIFPIMQVRFVSVNDGYDSEDKFGATGGMSVALKNLVYGMYSADLSKKVRSARDTRVRNGEFVGQFAPYGYRKDPEDKHRLLVDEEAALVVRRIFRMAAEGISHSEIARRLNGEGIPTRYMYHKLKGDNFPDKQPHVKIKKWDNSAVKDIVTMRLIWGLCSGTGRSAGWTRIRSGWSSPGRSGLWWKGSMRRWFRRRFSAGRMIIWSVLM